MRLIDADYLAKQLREQRVKLTGKLTEGINKGLNTALSLARNPDACPTIDAEPVKHGRWIEVHEHMWRKDGKGEIDEFAWGSDFHNGPVCEVCYATPCIHCKPDWENSKCSVASYRCSECNFHEKTAKYFCPNCGAKMDGERKET